MSTAESREQRHDLVCFLARLRKRVVAFGACAPGSLNRFTDREVSNRLEGAPWKIASELISFYQPVWERIYYFSCVWATAKAENETAG